MTKFRFTALPDDSLDKAGLSTIKKASLKYCYTETGCDKIRRLQPVPDPERVQKMRHQCTDMIALAEKNLQVPLANLGGLKEILERARAEGSVLSPEHFPEILNHARQARLLKDFFKRNSEHAVSLTELSGELQPLPEFEKSISESISESGKVKDSASTALKSIRSKLNRKRQAVRTAIQKMMKQAAKDGYASDEGPTIRGGRMVIPVQAQFKRKVKGFVHDVSSSGQTVYIEPVESLHINNEIRELEAEENHEIERILRKLTHLVRINTPALTLNEELTGEIDCIHAKVKIGLELNGAIPALSKGRELKIRDGYNPVLLLKHLREKTKETIVPLQVELSEKQLAVIVTGPNAGGKSVAMKTVGLVMLMHQSGFPVPVSPDSSLPVFSGFFLDMGDDQSIENDLSTFSSRLQWMRNTIKLADNASMVLIDEAAAGTDPDEGGALFQAFIEELIAKKALTIVTTHHGSLKAFAHEHPKAVNGSMEFNQNTLSPNYHFRLGMPGSSYAFEIAERLEVDEQIIRRARELVGSGKNRLENLISELETKLMEYTDLSKKHGEAAAKMEARQSEYQDKLESLKRQKEAIKAKALDEASRIMQSANRKIEEAVRQIREEGKENEKAIREARKTVEEHKKAIRKKVKKTKTIKKQKRNTEVPEPGDTVIFADGSATGELMELNGSRAVVMAGGLRLKTSISNLIKADKKNTPKKNVNRFGKKLNSTAYQPESISPKLDIRGFRGEEAVKKVMHYLDNAYARDLKNIEIIHGKGDGILKKLVHEHLGSRKEVSSYVTAPIEQGGEGCTLVTLR